MRVQAAEMKFNCFFLMPLVDEFPTRLREEVEAAYDNNMEDVFDVAMVRPPARCAPVNCALLSQAWKLTTPAAQPGERGGACVGMEPVFEVWALCGAGAQGSDEEAGGSRERAAPGGEAAEEVCTHPQDARALAALGLL